MVSRITVRRLLLDRPFIPAAVGGLLDGSESDGTQKLPAGSSNVAFTGADWNTVSLTKTNNFATAPDGNTTAAKLDDGTGANRHLLYSNVIIGSMSGKTVTVSVYAKNASGGRYIQLLPVSVGGIKAYAYFDLQAGSVTDSGAIGGGSIVSTSIAAAVNGFYKCSMDCTFSTDNILDYYQLAMSDVATYGSPLSSDSPSYTGANNLTYIWRPKVVFT